jgi:hypothetical protein
MYSLHPGFRYIQVGWQAGNQYASGRIDKDKFPQVFSWFSPVQDKITNINQSSTPHPPTPRHQQACVAHAPITRDVALLPDQLIQTGMNEFQLNILCMYDT